MEKHQLQSVLGSTEKSYEIFDRYTFKKEIGSGSSALIMEADDILTGETVCCKIIPKANSDINGLQNTNDRPNSHPICVSGPDIDSIASSVPKQPEVDMNDFNDQGDSILSVVAEISALKKLSHPNIAKFIDLFEDENHYYLLMELCNGVTLLQLINEKIESNKKFLQRDVKQIMKQILITLNYLHENNVAHRDLKPENIIIDTSCPGYMKVKIIDFGISSIKSEGQLSTTICGSLHYIAPEILRNEMYVGTKADIWSAGVIFYILLTNKLPFESENFEILRTMIISAQYELPIDSDIPSEATDLLAKMLNPDPSKRITAKEALLSDYLKFGNPLNCFSSGQISYMGPPDNATATKRRKSSRTVFQKRNSVSAILRPAKLTPSIKSENTGKIALPPLHS